MLDLDDFKAVNDALGHQAGDRLLAEIAAAIVAAGRDTDHVFRYGGDEFALILPGTDASVRARGRRARPGAPSTRSAAPGSRWADAGDRRSASRSALATFPRDGLTAESILLAADRACFVAKRTRPRPDRDGRRGPRARQRVLAPGADPGRPADHRLG